MDNLSKLFNIIDLLIDGPRVMKEISASTDMTLSELQKLIKMLVEYRIDNYWEIFFYDEEGNEIDADDFDELLKDIRRFEKVEMMACCDVFDNKFIDMLTYEERFKLFDLLVECKPSFVASEAEKIVDIFRDELEKKQESLSKRRLIKQNCNVFDFDKELFMKIYKAAEDKQAMDITMKNGRKIRGTSPLRLYYDEDTFSWYLEFSKFYKNRIMRLDNIADAMPSVYPYCTGKKRILGYGHGDEMDVKFRVYDDRNAGEAARRFLARKEIISIEKHNGFTEYEMKIGNKELFLRFVRSLGPHIVIMEPEILRNKMIESLQKWSKVYEIEIDGLQLLR